jgi:hypothetical protein
LDSPLGRTIWKTKKFPRIRKKDVVPKADGPGTGVVAEQG